MRKEDEPIKTLQQYLTINNIELTPWQQKRIKYYEELYNKGYKPQPYKMRGETQILWMKK